MPDPILSALDWDQVRATAAARQSLREAASLHGVSYAAVRMRASREKWMTPRRADQHVRAVLAEARNTIPRKPVTSSAQAVTPQPQAVTSAQIPVTSSPNPVTPASQGPLIRPELSEKPSVASVTVDFSPHVTPTETPPIASQPHDVTVLEPKPVTSAVTSPLTAAQAIESSYLEDGKQGRLAAAKATRKALVSLAGQDPQSIIEQSKALRDLTETSAKAGGWADPGANQAVTVNLAVMGHGMPSELRANYILPVDQSAGQDDD